MNKRILFVGNTGFSLYNFRFQLMKYAALNGWEVIAIACDESDYKKRFEDNHIRFINMNMDHKGMNPFSDLHIIWNLFKIYKKEKPFIVHHFSIKPVIYGTYAAKISKVRSIINTITGLGYVFEVGGWLERISILLYKFALKGRPYVIFLNSNDYYYFLNKKIISINKSYMIPGEGVDTKSLAPSNEQILDNPITFLLASRMLWSKGVKEFVYAAQELKQEYPEVRFVMAGGSSGGGAQGNPQAVPEEWLHRVNASGDAMWVGRLEHAQLMDMMDQAMVVVLPSYAEGIPKSLLEAASKAKAIITTDAPGCRDVVKHGVNGFLVPVKDVKSLANRMRNFIEQPDLAQQMGKEGRKRAVEMFDEKIVFEKTLSIYEEAIQK